MIVDYESLHEQKSVFSKHVGKDWLLTIGDEFGNHWGINENNLQMIIIHGRSMHQFERL